MDVITNSIQAASESVNLLAKEGGGKVGIHKVCPYGWVLVVTSLLPVGAILVIARLFHTLRPPRLTPAPP